MKNILVRGGFCFLVLVLSLTLIELFYCFSFNFMKDSSFKYVMDFIREKKYKRTLYISIFLNIVHCCVNICVIIFDLILLYIFSNFYDIDKVFTRNKEGEKDALEGRILGVLSRIIHNEKRLIWLASFFNLLLLSRNILVALILFYPVMKLKLWMYKYSCIPYTLILTGCVYIFSYLVYIRYILFRESYTVEYPFKFISMDFFRHILDLKLKRFNLVEVKSKSFTNVAISFTSDTACIYLFGDHTIFTKSELNAIFFHEIGHFVMNTIKMMQNIKTFTIVLMFAILTLVLRFSRRIEMANFKYHEISLLSECLFLAFSSRIFFITMNVIQQTEELECDSYSKKMMNPKYLAHSLIKLHLRHLNRFGFSRFYSFLKSSHPPLLTRIENLLF